MSRNAFGASWARAFVRSPAYARGTYAAGIKTAHACVPYNGFGNTVNPDGSCTNNPAIKWTYTKKVVSVAWTYSYGGWTNSNDLETQQSLLNPGYSPGDMTPSGYILSDYSGPPYKVFPTAPAPASDGNSTKRSEQYFPWFTISGTTLSVRHDVSGTLDNGPDTSIGASTPSGIGSWVSPTTIAPSPITGFPGMDVGVVTTNTLIGVSSAVTEINAVSLPIISGVFGAVGYLTVGANFIWGVEQVKKTITTVYSDPVALADIETAAGILLNGVHLDFADEHYYTFDGTPSVVLNWNPTDFAGYSLDPFQVTLQRAELVSGVLGSYSNLASAMGSSATTFLNYTDSSAVLGHTYYYRYFTVGHSANPAIGFVSSGFSTPVIVTIARQGPPFVYEFPAFTPSGVNNPNNPPTGMVAFQDDKALIWTKPPTALNANQQIILFRTSATNDFVISANVTCGTPMPFFIAARQMRYNESPLSISVTGASGYVWSKSRGYLPGNSPNHVPPVVNTYAEKFYYKPGLEIGGGAIVDVSSLFRFFRFPHGRGGAYSWQLSKLLPSEKESYGILDVPAPGYILWPLQSAAPAPAVGAGSITSGAGAAGAGGESDPGL